MLAASYTRPLVVKYNKEITYTDRKNNQLKENMIAFGNIASVFYVALVIILLAKVNFVAEICMFHHTTMEQKVRLWISMGFYILTFIKEVTKRNLKGCQCPCCSILYSNCKFVKTDAVSNKYLGSGANQT